MLTKKECENKLKNLKTLQDEINKNCTLNVVANIAFTNAIECFEDLIKEHFDNPPLKFDELEENMWVWDNKRKVKLLIAYCYSEYDMGYYNFSNPEDYKYIHIEFEENRFYRKEVQE